MMINNRRTIITIFVSYTVILSILVAFIFRRDLGILSDWFFVIPNVITIELFSVLLFNNYLWKCRLFKNWLVVFPDMSGTWMGRIKSSYVNPKTGKQVDPIPCMLVIKHKFNKISIKLYTEESISYSFSEEIDFDPDRMIKRISYSYTNEPKTLLDYRSSNHRGTVILNLVNNIKLNGYYYTDRNTKGELELEFHTKTLLDELPQDIVKHPMTGH